MEKKIEEPVRVYISKSSPPSYPPTVAQSSSSPEDVGPCPQKGQSCQVAHKCRGTTFTINIL